MRFFFCFCLNVPSEHINNNGWNVNEKTIEWFTLKDEKFMRFFSVSDLWKRIFKLWRKLKAKFIRWIGLSITMKNRAEEKNVMKMLPSVNFAIRKKKHHRNFQRSSLRPDSINLIIIKMFIIVACEIYCISRSLFVINIWRKKKRIDSFNDLYFVHLCRRKITEKYFVRFEIMKTKKYFFDESDNKTGNKQTETIL